MRVLCTSAEAPEVLFGSRHFSPDSSMAEDIGGRQKI